jgi:hypothetical protein
MAGHEQHARLTALLDRTQPAPSGCWLWTGTHNGNGYGQIAIRLGGVVTTVGAHRAMYAHLVGPIGDGLEIDHLCRVRDCVNPDHLEAVTREENMRRTRKPKPVTVQTDAYKRLVEDWYRECGRLCEAHRRARRLTLRQAATLTNGAVTFQALHRIEQGTLAPREHVKVALSHAYRLDVEDLFPPLRQVEVVRRLAA